MNIKPRLLSWPRKLADVMIMPDAKAYGHVERDSDGEISCLCLEGVFLYKKVTKNVLKDFYDYFRLADDITVEDDYIGCWYD